MILTREEESMVQGKHGPGIQRCMNILIKFGEAFGAEKLVRISSAHVFNFLPPDLLEELSEGVGRCENFTTIHPYMSLCDPGAFEELGLSHAHFEARQADQEIRDKIYDRLGFFRNYTCAALLVGNFVKKGDFVSWFGSSVQVFINSVIGAKQNRDGAVINMAAAITGRAPQWGLFLDENRHAELLVEMGDLDTSSLSRTDYAAIGYYVGGIAQERNTAIAGLKQDLSLEEIRYLLTPISTSGSVSLCHLVGITPESPTLEAAFGGRAPQERILVGRKEIRETKERFSPTDPCPVDLVIFGCPHCTIQEIKKIASLLEGRKVGTSQRLWIGTAGQISDFARECGFAQPIEKAGGVFARACMATIPDCPIPQDVRVVATNSFKTAHYVSAISKGRIRTIVGETEQCIEAAIQGKWRGES